jgi:glycerol-3-phosphate cytidylyltransferase
MEKVKYKKGFTCSCFDLFHAGHVLMLKEAKQQCEWLIVGLQTDPTIDRPEKNKPIQSVFERYTQLEGCRYVDQIVVYDTEKDLLNLLTSYHINVRIVGNEYQFKEFTGKNLYPIYYNSRSHGYSTTELRKRVAEAEQRKVK